MQRICVVHSSAHGTGAALQANVVSRGHLAAAQQKTVDIFFSKSKPNAEINRNQLACHDNEHRAFQQCLQSQCTCVQCEEKQKTRPSATVVKWSKNGRFRSVDSRLPTMFFTLILSLTKDHSCMLSCFTVVIWQLTALYRQSPRSTTKGDLAQEFG